MTELQKALNIIIFEVIFISDNMENFIFNFCFKDTYDVYGISFDGLNIKWKSVNKNGEHFYNQKTIAQYLRWKDKVNETIRP